MSVVSENKTARDRVEESDEDLNTQRALLMKQLRREKVQCVYSVEAKQN